MGKEGDAVCASVVHGRSSTITYLESEDVRDPHAAIDKFEGWHVAFYLANFSTVYDTVKDAGLNLLDHKYNDKSPTLEDALRWSQFRMQDITAVDDSPEDSPTQFKKGDVLYRFGHEVRSLYHPRYLPSEYVRCHHSSTSEQQTCSHQLRLLPAPVQLVCQRQVNFGP